MVTLSHVVCALALMVMLPSDVLGQRGQTYPKKKPVAPVVPEVDDPDVQGNREVKGTIDECCAKVEDLENTVIILKRDKVQMEQAINILRMSQINLHRTMQVIASKVTEMDKLANQNTKLLSLLEYFETFFGVLYEEAPEAFDDTVTIETRLSRMNTYLGNREAELAGLRPHPRVVVQPEDVNSKQVTDAVLQLSQENAKLASKVAILETEVADLKSARKPGTVAIGTAVASCTCRDDQNLTERMERLETTSAILLSPQLVGNTDSGSATSRKAGSPVPRFTVDEIDILRSDLIASSSRSTSDTRKSVFSAIRHTSMIGDGERQVLSFDNVHINKGGNFQNNSVFVCTTEGFYFYHFTVRSYDGHYMGVALVKNQELMTSVYMDASELSIMQSQSIVLHMTKGDRVWLELAPSERFAIHSDVHKYITFNGFLVYKGR